MVSNTESQISRYQNSVSLLQAPVTTISNSSNNVITSIKGIKFINTHEMAFVEVHRANYPNIVYGIHIIIYYQLNQVQHGFQMIIIHDFAQFIPMDFMV